MFELNSLDFMTFRIKLSSGQVKEFDLAKELSINEDSLDKDFMEQAGKYAWWAELEQIARSKLWNTEKELEKAEAKADKLVRKELELDGIKITEALVKNRIKLDDNYNVALDEYFKTKKYVGALEKIVKAFEHRRDMLINYGAMIRKNEKLSK